MTKRNKRMTSSDKDASDKKNKQAPGHVNRTKNRSAVKNKSTWGWGTRLKVALVLTGFLAMIGFVLFDVVEVSSNAMLPTMSKGDTVLTLSPAFMSLDYKAGDVVYVESSQGVTPNFLRMVTEPDQTVRYYGDKLEINGHKPGRLLLTNPSIVRPADTPEVWRETLENGRNYRILLPKQGIHGPLAGEVKLRSETAFLVGDNRMASYDSRQTGPVSLDECRGKPLLILYSSQNDGLLGHWLKFL